MSLSQENVHDSQNSQQSSGDSQNGFCTPKQFRHKRLDLLLNQYPKSPAVCIPASPMMQRLGYGTGVGVFEFARSPNPTGEMRSPWAIKKVSKLREQREEKEIYCARLEYEAEILRHLSHPNIIGYRAFGNPTSDVAFLAMEKASKSLGDLIEERSEEQTLMLDSFPFPANYIERVAIDLAKALVYLHNEKKLIHGDLKSPNVLIFGDFQIAKLCDFGVSRKIKEDGSLEGKYIGTEIWNPMEVILENRGQKTYPVTSKSDIYPYGLTLHEMISLKPPHFGTAENDYAEESDINAELSSEVATNDSEGCFDEAAFDVALAKQLGKRPNLPDMDFNESYNLILGVFYCCTEEDPSKRPTAKTILEVLETKTI